MPQCYCQWGSCNGATVDQRTLDTHQRQDKMQRFREAQVVATKACEDHEDSISAYISTLTLSDNATGESLDSGGRLWSRSSSSSPPSIKTVSSSQAPVTEALKKLRDTEKAIDTLIAESEQPLQTLDKPSICSQVFPLKSILSAARTLQGNLCSIKSRDSSVRATKSLIEERLSAFILKLKNAQTKWNKHLGVLPEEKNHIPIFDTGECGFTDMSI